MRAAPDFSGAIPDRFAISLAEGDVAGWRFANSGAPRLLFAHANGFCASAYKKMLGLVAAQFDVFAIDLRGHGRTTLPADPSRLRDWRIYGRDIAAVLDHPSLSGDGAWVLAGHSCGAVSAALAARARDDVAELILIEPVAAPPWTPLLARSPFWPGMARRWPLVRGALSRRRFWPDRDAAERSYARKPLFARWAQGALADYLEDGLSERGGGVALACDPEWEAATFAAQGHDFWRAVAATSAPMRVLGADPAHSTLYQGAARRFRKQGATVQTIAGAGHLLPMENPRIAADFILGADAS